MTQFYLDTVWRLYQNYDVDRGMTLVGDTTEIISLNPTGQPITWQQVVQEHQDGVIGFTDEAYLAFVELYR